MSKAGADSELLHAHGRLLARTVAHLMLDEIARLTEKFDGDYIKALVELSIIQATRLSGVAGAENKRSISVRAIGASLGFSYETGRRKVRELEAEGHCVRVSPNRLVIAPGLLETADYESECEGRWRNLRSYVIELRDIGFDFNKFSHLSPQIAVRAPTPQRSIAGLMDDFILRLGEARITNEEDTLNSNIISAVMTLNGDPMRFDRELTWTYAGGDTPPPDSVRAPATIAMVARRLKLTEDVVGRRMNMYLERGWIRRVPGGYLFVMNQQLTPEAHKSRNLMNLRFLQLIQALRPFGIDPVTVTTDDSPSPAAL